MRVNQLRVRCYSQAFTPRFFGNAMKIGPLKYSDILKLLHIRNFLYRFTSSKAIRPLKINSLLRVKEIEKEDLDDDDEIYI